jgi:hypothetical protein
LALGSSFGGVGAGWFLADFFGRMFLKASNILIQLCRGGMYNLQGSLKIIRFSL